MLEWLKRKLPSQEDFLKNPKFKSINRFFHHPDYWHFHCHSVSKAVGIGLFINFLPVPFQMFFAALFSLIMKANVPVSVALTWLNNPFTFIPINVFMYKVGSFLMGGGLNVKKLPSWNLTAIDWSDFFSQFIAWLVTYGKTYGVGVIVVSVGASVLGYLITLAVWKGVYCIKRYRQKGFSADNNHL